MVRGLVFSFALFFAAFSMEAAPSSYFSTRLARALPGDYIVAKQPGSYCVLILRSRENEKIVLEEIDIPDYAVNLKTVDWKAWIAKRAPGNSSWGMLSIDLAKGELLEAYSVTKHSFLTLSKEEQFFLQLLSLPTERLSGEERRKIGPPPLAGDEDRRSLWQPKISFEGKPQKNPTSVYRAVWPKDDSILSSCKVDFYFDDKLPDFPFPVWVEITGGYFKTRLAVIEAGRGLVSPARGIPKSDDTRF